MIQKITPVQHIDCAYYHKNCSDGIGGAFPFDMMRVRRIYGVNDHNTTPDVFEGDTVIIVDFCFSVEVLTEMCSIAETVIVLDHHETSVDIFMRMDDVDNFQYIYDKYRSGAQISWDYATEHFAEESYYFDREHIVTANDVGIGDHDARPWFIDIIGDRDLWNFELKNSKEISEGMYRGQYSTLNKMSEMIQLDIGESMSLIDIFVRTGHVFLSTSKKSVNYAISKAQKCVLNGHRVLLTQCERYYRSEVGSELAKAPGVEFAAIFYYYHDDDTWRISLRSVGHNNSAILAESFGGGGHEHAAAFTIGGVDTPGTLRDFFIPEEW